MPEEATGDRILHILSIYPKISPSMLQIALGQPAAVWRPILETMIEEKKVHRSLLVAESPSGRHQSYTCLSLGAESPVQAIELDAKPKEAKTNGTHATI